jgi:hypothetical protein
MVIDPFVKTGSHLWQDKPKFVVTLCYNIVQMKSNHKQGREARTVEKTVLSVVCWKKE